MPQSERVSLWEALNRGGQLSSRSIQGVASRVILSDLARGSILGEHLEQLRDRSIVLATEDQFATALALIELDGIARRMVLYPSDLPREHLRAVIAAANADAILSDSDLAEAKACGVESVIYGSGLAKTDCERGGSRPTEWVMLTSGTTGAPKLTVHTLATLTGAIASGIQPSKPRIWSTFYDIRRYGGLQILLRALLDGGSMVLSSSHESTADFLARVAAAGVTHISGTPSHWRRALMSGMAHRFAPEYVRLSGEIADQAILDNLRTFFPKAAIVHAFASTEAGVGFEVRDGRAGFPAEFMEKADSRVEMKIEDGSLRIRSARTAIRYLGSETLTAENGFVDTGDLVELRDSRYYFAGRRDGVINVGGAKVHPEEVEAVLNRHPQVRMALVKARKNPFTCSIVVADVVLKSAIANDASSDAAALKRELIAACHDALAGYKVPAAIRFVPSLDVTASGKLARISA
jgi:acyl-coenzyme A synthetase/AMP-(fatty) acid ligase